MAPATNRDRFMAWYDDMRRAKDCGAYIVFTKDGGVTGMCEFPNAAKLPPCKRWRRVCEEGLST